MQRSRGGRGEAARDRRAAGASATTTVSYCRVPLVPQSPIHIPIPDISTARDPSAAHSWRSFGSDGVSERVATHNSASAPLFACV
ncbi:hypothetical protein RR46_02867 [Papilio xuthus]|uniref:Uncharacterized protein n=1 Tax=Papilio xuthus TaxID=66420 RepID=A0A194QD89_PAPXU|nr:hypothetical protein RR46_02867 [Papilio xuthus]